MTETLKYAAVAVCAAAAGVLAFYGKDGWGWFLFVAFLGLL